MLSKNTHNSYLTTKNSNRNVKYNQRHRKYLQSRHGSKKIEIISMNKLTISKICDQTL